MNNLIKYGAIFYIFISYNPLLYSQLNSILFNSYSNDFILNPALGARWDFSQFSANYLDNWRGFENNPKVYQLNAIITDVENNKFAFHGYLQRNKENYLSQTQANLGFTYNIINIDYTLSAGLAYTHRFQNIDGSSIRFLPGQNIQIENIEFSNSYGVDFGIFFSSKDPLQQDRSHFISGIAVKNLGISSGETLLSNERKININFLTGYRFINQKNNIEPRIILDYNLETNSILNSSAKIIYENFDYGRRKSPIGFYGDLGYLLNQSIIDFPATTYITSSFGIIKNIPSSTRYDSDNHLIKLGVYFAIGIGENLADASTMNVGINATYQLYNTTFLLGD